MNKTVFVSLIFLIIFSGCLLQPQITIKSAVLNGDFIKVNLHSNKQINAEIQLSDESDLILCSQNTVLNSGNNEVQLKCFSSDSNIKVTVFADGTVFSNDLELEFDETDIESKVIFLAETKTFEGEALKVIENGTAKQNQCNALDYVAGMKAYFGFASVYSDSSSQDFINTLDNLTSEQLQLLDEQLTQTKNCNMFIEKELTDFGDGKYSVSYSWVGKGDCFYAGQTRRFEYQKNVVVIEVNLKNNSAKTTSGGITDSYTDEEQARKMIKGFEVLGGCFKALMLGIDPISGIIYEEIEPSKASEVKEIQINSEDLNKSSWEDLNATVS